MSDETDLDEAFKTGSIFTASKEVRERFLRVLGHINVNGESHQIRAVNRALVINHLQMGDVIKKLETTIERLNAENGTVSYRVLILTWIALGAALVQVFGVVRPIFWPDDPVVEEHGDHGSQNHNDE